MGCCRHSPHDIWYNLVQLLVVLALTASIVPSVGGQRTATVRTQQELSTAIGDNATSEIVIDNSQGGVVLDLSVGLGLPLIARELRVRAQEACDVRTPIPAEVLAPGSSGSNDGALCDKVVQIAATGSRALRVYGPTGKLFLGPGIVLVGPVSAVGGGISVQAGGRLICSGVFFLGTSAASGGAIKASGNNTQVETQGCVFHSTTATTGGALSLEDGAQAISSDDIFVNCTAHGSGGAVHVAGSPAGSEFIAHGSLFSNCSAAVTGGAIFADGPASVVSLVQVNVTTCTAGPIGGDDDPAGEGGGIGITGGSRLEGTGIYLSACAAGQRGGGLFIAQESSAHCQGCSFIDCTAAEDAGGVMVKDASTLDTANCSWSRNRADDGDGGGLYVTDEGSQWMSAGDRFAGNYADSTGAAFLVTDGAQGDCSDVLIVDNESGDDGGGAAVKESDSMLLLTRAQVVGNTCDDRGAGVLVKDGGGVRSRASTYARNVAKKACAGMYVTDEGSTGSFTDDVFLENRCLGDDGGAGCVANAGIATSVRSKYMRNRAHDDGGAIRVNDDGGIFRSQGDVFERNECNNRGGAVFVNEGGSLVVVGSKFKGNVAHIAGGAVFVTLSSADVSDASVEGNVADVAGAGVQVTSGSAAVIRNTTFTGNRGPAGPALFVEGPNAGVELTGCQVAGNQASGVGGALFLQIAAVVNSMGNDFWNNTATSGGALYVSDKATQMRSQGDTYQDNYGQVSGGAAVVHSHGLLIAEDATWTNNWADSVGGTLQIDGPGSGASIIGGVLSGSHAGGSCGGFFVANSGQLVLQGVRVINSSVGDAAGEHGDGGAGCVLSGATLESSGCLFSGCHAPASGGAILMSGDDSTLLSAGDIYQHNAAGRYAGALALADGGQMMLTDATLERNRAGWAGGALRSIGAGPIGIKRTAFKGNVATVGGGAALDCPGSDLAGACANVSACTFTDNTARGGSGGAIWSSDPLLVGCEVPGRPGLAWVSAVIGCMDWSGNVAVQGGWGGQCATEPKSLMATPNFYSDHQSGMNFEPAVMVLAVDGYGQHVPTHEGVVSASLVGAANASSIYPANASSANAANASNDIIPSRAASLGARLTEGMRNGSANFTDLSVTAMPGSYYIRLDETGLRSAYLEVSVRPCRPGEVRQGLACVACASPLFFSFNPTNASCDMCPPGALCLDSALVVAAPGYWHSAPTSLEFHACLNEGACTGQGSPGGNNGWGPTAQPSNQLLLYSGLPPGPLDLQSDLASGASSGGELSASACAPGYQGTLCAQCADGFGLTTSFECRRCPSQAATVAYYCVLLLAYASTVAFLTHKALDARCESDDVLVTMDLVKMLLSYLQLLGILFTFSIRWPPAIRGVLGVSKLIASIGGGVLAFRCTLHDGPHLSAALKDMLAYASLPPLLVVTALLVWTTLFCWHASRGTLPASEFKSRQLCRSLTAGSDNSGAVPTPLGRLGGFGRNLSVGSSTPVPIEGTHVGTGSGLASPPGATASCSQPENAAMSPLGQLPPTSQVGHHRRQSSICEDSELELDSTTALDEGKSPMGRNGPEADTAGDEFATALPLTLIRPWLSRPGSHRRRGSGAFEDWGGSAGLLQTGTAMGKASTFSSGGEFTILLGEAGHLAQASSPKHTSLCGFPSAVLPPLAGAASAATIASAPDRIVMTAGHTPAVGVANGHHVGLTLPSESPGGQGGRHEHLDQGEPGPGRHEQHQPRALNGQHQQQGEQERVSSLPLDGSAKSPTDALHLVHISEREASHGDALSPNPGQQSLRSACSAGQDGAAANAVTDASGAGGGGSSGRWPRWRGYVLPRLLVTILCGFFFIWPNVVERLLSIFACIRVDEGDPGRPYHGNSAAVGRYWLEDMSQECFVGNHLVIALAVGVPGTLLFGLGWPLGVVAFLWAHRAELEDPLFRHTFGFLCHGLRPTAYFWDGLVLLSKLALLLVAVFSATEEFPQLLSGLMVVLLTLFLAGYLRPYSNRRLNFLHHLVWFCNLVTLICGLWLAYPQLTDGGERTITAAFMIANGTLVVIMLRLIFLYVCRDWQRNRGDLAGGGHVEAMVDTYCGLLGTLLFSLIKKGVGKITAMLRGCLVMGTGHMASGDRPIDPAMATAHDPQQQAGDICVP